MTKLILGLVCLIGFCPSRGAYATNVQVRQEDKFLFALDQDLLRADGIQFFYELDKGVSANSLFSPALQLSHVLDTQGELAASGEVFHVLVTRAAYDVNKDISFFQAPRLLDPVYMNAILPGYGIRQLETHRYSVSATPANTFTLDLVGRDQILSSPATSAEQAIVRWEAGLGVPDLIVKQHNYGFSRVMGVRTSLMSRTFTAHYSLGAGRTRIIVTSLSYLYNIPPFFLGGAGRVYKEARKGALTAIQNLRAY
jgi:hypothetical protein